MEREKPIGVFDSGLGGISVLKSIHRLLPHEHLYFYGDSKHAPYGEKTRTEVTRLTEHVAAHLVAENVKALVIACNTATSAALETLRAHYAQLPVIGMEPALKPAALSASQPTVIVMATHATLQQNRYHALVERFERQAKIYPLPCPALVTFVERGETNSPVVRQYIREQLDSLHLTTPVDAIVLGCTHFPFVKKAILEVVGRNVQIFDGALGAAKQLHRRLRECQLLNESQAEGKIHWENSSDDPAFLERSRMLFAMPLD